MDKVKAIAFIKKCATSHINNECKRHEAMLAAKEMNDVIAFVETQNLASLQGDAKHCVSTGRKNKG